MKKIVLLGGIVLGLVPAFTFAAAGGADANVFGILAVINKILNVAIPILITAAVVYFIWGVIQYTVSGDEEKKKKAKGMIIQGLVGLFVIIAFWGIIAIITNTFGVGPAQLENSAIPCIENLELGITCP